MRAYNYFELKRGKRYLCNLDDPNYRGKFEYKLHKHYLVYRKIEGDWDYDKGRLSFKWRGVWNPDWYNDNKAFFVPIDMTHKTISDALPMKRSK